MIAIIFDVNDVSSKSRKLTEEDVLLGRALKWITLDFERHNVKFLHCKIKQLIRSNLIQSQKLTFSFGSVERDIAMNSTRLFGHSSGHVSIAS